MLVLGRKLNESVCIGSNIKIRVSRIDRDCVRLSIDAPREVDIYREELFLKIEREKALASEETPESVSMPSL